MKYLHLSLPYPTHARTRTSAHTPLADFTKFKKLISKWTTDGLDNT